MLPWKFTRTQIFQKTLNTFKQPKSEKKISNPYFFIHEKYKKTNILIWNNFKKQVTRKFTSSIWTNKISNEMIHDTFYLFQQQKKLK